MLEEYSLESKTALITGSGRGLGRAIALVFAEAGADIILASRTVNELEETSREVKKYGSKCLVVPTDITDSRNVLTLIDKTISTFGKLDILVNNAGVGFTKPMIVTPGLEKLRMAQIVPDYTTPATDEQWDIVWNTNVKSVMSFANAIVPMMVKAGKGKIINLSSAGAKRYIGSQGIYPAAKAAIESITRGMAIELARFNINVNAIGPGGFLTQMMDHVKADEAVNAHFLRSVPLKRYGNPREVGLLALYLASKASDYMTGQVIYIDGGLSI
jgi:NAD(P)-dependent dehydrogenase (short-subunit alcohol dehydrogenase family)